MAFKCPIAVPKFEGDGPITLKFLASKGDWLEKGELLFELSRGGHQSQYAVNMPCVVLELLCQMDEVVQPDQIVAMVACEGEAIPYGRPYVALKNSKGMVIPDEFMNLCGQFDMELLQYHGSPEKLIASALKGTTPKARADIQTFLADLLSGEHDLAAIEAVWEKTPARFFLSNGQQLVAFLVMVREMAGGAADEPK